MTEKIGATLKRLAAATSRAPNVEGAGPTRPTDLLGDPDCPHCHGVGYVSRDLPVGHPDFGKLEICVCRQAEVQGRLRDQLFRLSRLEELRHLTFDSFEPQGRVGLGEQERASLEQAFNQARMYADDRQGWLLLQGDFGCGKTHLAAAIANAAVMQGVPSLFLTVPDLLDALRFAFDAEEVTFEERFEQIRGAPLLVLDDFGTQHATEWAREKLFQILNHRYINRLPLVITTNLALEELEGRVRSRLSDPELVKHITIRAPDFRRPVEDSRQHALSSLPLHAQQTFGTWVERKDERIAAQDLRTLADAFRVAQKYSEDPRGWLVFMGPFGSGKTHLAASIANYRAGSGEAVMFVVVPDLLDHLRATFSPNSAVSYDRRFEDVRSAPLLVLDDLGTQTATPWAREKLYQLFNHRYNAALPTIITTAEDDEKIDPRLLARFHDTRMCTIVRISMPGFRGAPERPRPRR
ncbi:MAG: ATP-binding protein [Anaerolineales bacterium]